MMQLHYFSCGICIILGAKRIMMFYNINESE